MITSSINPEIEAARFASPAKQPTDLREACEQFEGLLLGMILKDSLRPVFSDEDSPPGMDMFKDFGIEQVAASLASEAPLGLADELIRAEELAASGGASA